MRKILRLISVILVVASLFNVSVHAELVVPGTNAFNEEIETISEEMAATTYALYSHQYSGRWPAENTSSYYPWQDTDTPMAWNLRTKSTVKVGILDGGVFTTHPDLSGNMVGSVDFSNDGQGNVVVSEHGTLLAGVIGAVGNNGIGTAGLCWDVDMVSMRVRGGASYDTAICDAIDYATANNIKILNCSFGTATASDLLKDKVENFDGLIICSAGNSGVNTDNVAHFPSNIESANIISVGASNRDVRYVGATKASNYGATTVDVFAPGYHLYTTYTTIADVENYTLSHSYVADEENSSGTSLAAAYVSGLAALIWGTDPTMDWSTVKTAILENVDTLPALEGLCATGGRVNVYKALTSVMTKNTPQTVTGDVNGDGYEDMVVTGNADGYFRFTSFLGQSDGSFGQGITTYTDESFTNTGKSGKEKLYIGDFNDDGKDDLMLHYVKSDNLRRLMFYTALGAGTFSAGRNVNIEVVYDLTNYHSQSFVADVTGDGADDFVMHMDNGSGKRLFKVFAGADGQSNAWVSANAVSTVSERSYVSTDPVYMGDVSGDGKADLVVHWVNSSTSKRQLLTYIADSGGKFKEAVNLATSNTHDEVQYPGKMTLGDYSGDGKADFVVMWKNSNGKRCLLVYKSTGSTFAAGSHVLTSVRAYLASDPIHFTDVTGDGRMDVVVHWVDSATEYRQLMTYVATASGYNEAVNCATSNKHNTTTYPTTQHMLNADGAVGKDFVGKWTSAASNHILRLKTYKAKSSANYFNPTTVDTDMNYFPYYVYR